MPWTMKKVGKGRYKVTTPHGTKAKNTTKEKAQAQIRLLKAIEHNPEFRRKIRRGRK